MVIQRDAEGCLAVGPRASHDNRRASFEDVRPTRLGRPDRGVAHLSLSTQKANAALVGSGSNAKVFVGSIIIAHRCFRVTAFTRKSSNVARLP